MKERPILMNGAMVRAVLDGSKTQTRRIVKPQPFREDYMAEEGVRLQFATLAPHGQPGDGIWVRETFFAYGRWVTRYSEKKARDEWHFIDMTIECDRTYQYDADSPEVPLAAGRGGALPGWYMRPSIFMPRAACRILLEIISVRIERLQEISDADIVAEGIDMEALVESQDRYDIVCKGSDASGRATERSAWRDLWESTGGDWNANPWCWAITFKRVAP